MSKNVKHWDIGNHNEVDVAIILQNAAVYLTNPVARRVSDQPRVNVYISSLPYKTVIFVAKLDEICIFVIEFVQMFHGT